MYFYMFLYLVCHHILMYIFEYIFDIIIFCQEKNGGKLIQNNKYMINSQYIIKRMQNQSHSDTHQRFTISPIYSQKIQAQNEKNTRRLKLNLNQHQGDLRLKHAQSDYTMDDDNAEFSLINGMLNSMHISYCQEVIADLHREKQTVFTVIEGIRKSLCLKDIVNNLNLIMNTGLYQPIIKYSLKLATKLLQNTCYSQYTYLPTNKQAQILRECLWIVTNLCTGTQQQIAKMIKAGLITLADKCLMMVQYKFIIASTLQLIGNLVGDYVLEVKLHFLDNVEFQGFYLYCLPDYWYEDDGMFSQKIVWILSNAFKKVPTMIAQDARWKEIINKYIPVFKMLLQLCFNTTSTSISTGSKTWLQNGNNIQSQPFLLSQNTNISSFPYGRGFRTSSKTIRNCYNLFVTVTCVDYPYLCRTLHGIVKRYDFYILPDSSRKLVVAMYSNFIGFYGLDGIKLLYEYGNVINYIIEQITIQQPRLISKNPQKISTQQKSLITTTCLQLLLQIFSYKDSVLQFLQPYYYKFQEQLLIWLSYYKNRLYIYTELLGLILQLLQISIQEKFVWVINNIFYQVVEYVDHGISYVVDFVDNNALTYQYDDFAYFLEVVKKYLQIYVLYLQYLIFVVKECDNQQAKFQHFYKYCNQNTYTKQIVTKLNPIGIQHKKIEEVLQKIYNIYQKQSKDKTKIKDPFITQIHNISHILNNNANYIQNILLECQMGALSFGNL